MSAPKLPVLATNPRGWGQGTSGAPRGNATKRHGQRLSGVLWLVRLRGVGPGVTTGASDCLGELQYPSVSYAKAWKC